MAETTKRPAMIEADRLSKFYGPFAATRNVSFQVHEGEVVAFLGPNGAGKSTTMKLLTGYLSPSEGRAKIAGHDMGLDRLAGSARLGYLPENGPLYRDMTPHGLLDFFADARGLSRTRKAERVEAVVDLCALGDVVNKPISKLSRGYRQRVVSTHILQEVQAMASRVILINEGQLVFDGSVADLQGEGATLQEAFYDLTAGATV
jgi:ABC-2 type transport system ATP-binding protein